MGKRGETRPSSYIMRRSVRTGQKEVKVHLRGQIKRRIMLELTGRRRGDKPTLIYFLVLHLHCISKLIIFKPESPDLTGFNPKFAITYFSLYEHLCL